MFLGPNSWPDRAFAISFFRQIARHGALIHEFGLRRGSTENRQFKITALQTIVVVTVTPSRKSQQTNRQPWS